MLNPEPDSSLRKRVLYVVDGPRRRAEVEVARGEELERYAWEVNLRRRTASEEHWP